MQLTNFDRLSFLARTVGDTHTDHAMIRTTRIPGDIFCESILGLSGCINTTNPPSMDTGDLMLSLYFHFEFVIAIWVALAIVSIMPSTSIVALCGALRAGMQFLIKDVHQNVTFFVGILLSRDYKILSQ
jgi:small-conductance mechanosensitive channel